MTCQECKFLIVVKHRATEYNISLKSPLLSRIYCSRFHIMRTDIFESLNYEFTLISDYDKLVLIVCIDKFYCIVRKDIYSRLVEDTE